MGTITLVDGYKGIESATMTALLQYQPVVIELKLPLKGFILVIQRKT